MKGRASAYMLSLVFPKSLQTNLPGIRVLCHQTGPAEEAVAAI